MVTRGMVTCIREKVPSIYLSIYRIEYIIAKNKEIIIDKLCIQYTRKQIYLSISIYLFILSINRQNFQYFVYSFFKWLFVYSLILLK